MSADRTPGFNRRDFMKSTAAVLTAAVIPPEILSALTPQESEYSFKFGPENDLDEYSNMWGTGYGMDVVPSGTGNGEKALVLHHRESDEFKYTRVKILGPDSKLLSPWGTMIERPSDWSQLSPYVAIVGYPDGNYLAAYSGINTNGSYEIGAQLIDSQGLKVGSHFRLAEGLIGMPLAFNLSRNPDTGNLMVLWRKYQSGYEGVITNAEGEKIAGIPAVDNAYLYSPYYKPACNYNSTTGLWDVAFFQTDNPGNYYTGNLSIASIDQNGQYVDYPRVLSENGAHFGARIFTASDGLNYLLYTRFAQTAYELVGVKYDSVSNINRQEIVLQSSDVLAEPNVTEITLDSKRLLMLTWSQYVYGDGGGMPSFEIFVKLLDPDCNSASDAIQVTPFTTDGRELSFPVVNSEGTTATAVYFTPLGTSAIYGGPKSTDIDISKIEIFRQYLPLTDG